CVPPPPANGELADGARRHWADELLDLGARLVRLDGPHNLGGPDDDQPCSGDDREDHDRADRPGDYHPPSRLSLRVAPSRGKRVLTRRISRVTDIGEALGNLA